jgi:methyl-accepting chemotaxis protein
LFRLSRNSPELPVPELPELLANARSIDDAVDVVRLLSREVETLIVAAGHTNERLQAGLSAFVDSSRDELGRMATSAELLCAASLELAKAGASITASVDGISDALDRFLAANLSLAGSVTSMATIVDAYENGQNAFAETIASLRSTIEGAKEEAFATSKMVASIQAAATQLANASMQSENYLGRVNDVLTKAHLSFAENIDKTLSYGNARFHTELAKAVDLLAGGIRDLEDALSTIPARNQ